MAGLHGFRGSAGAGTTSRADRRNSPKIPFCCEGAHGAVARPLPGAHAHPVCAARTPSRAPLSWQHVPRRRSRVLARRFVHSLWRRRCVGWWGGAVSPRASAPWARSATTGRDAPCTRSAPNSCGATRIRSGPWATGDLTRSASSRSRHPRGRPPPASPSSAAAGPPTSSSASGCWPPAAGHCAISPPGPAVTRRSYRSAAASPWPGTSPVRAPSSTRPGPTAPPTPPRPSRSPTSSRRSWTSVTSPHCWPAPRPPRRWATAPPTPGSSGSRPGTR